MVTFSNEVSIGNLITLGVVVIGGVRAWTSLHTRAALNVSKIDSITKRLDEADLERLKVCVETMWLFQLRRGLAEVETKKLGTSNSPVILTKKANDLMQPLLPELKQFYNMIHGEELGLVELAIELERQFGNRLVSEVCKKVGVSDAACLVLAIGQLRPIGPDTLREALEQCEDANDLKQKSKSLL